MSPIDNGKLPFQLTLDEATAELETLNVQINTTDRFLRDADGKVRRDDNGALVNESWVNLNRRYEAVHGQVRYLMGKKIS